MKKIETKITINASAQEVWDVLMDFRSHSFWNPFIKSISGVPEVGNKIQVVLGGADDKGMRFNPLVLVNEKQSEFRWKGKLLVKGVFDGEHYFLLKQTADNKCSFTQGEKFSGILVPFLSGVLKDTQDSFKLMNDALKMKVEEGIDLKELVD